MSDLDERKQALSELLSVDVEQIEEDGYTQNTYNVGDGESEYIVLLNRESNELRFYVDQYIENNICQSISTHLFNYFDINMWFRDVKSSLVKHKGHCIYLVNAIH